LFLPLGQIVRPGHQATTVLVQRVILASTPPGRFSLQALPTPGELLGGQVHHMKWVHHLRRRGQGVVHGGGVTGEAVHRHHLNRLAERFAALLQPAS